MRRCGYSGAPDWADHEDPEFLVDDDEECFDPGDDDWQDGDLDGDSLWRALHV